MLGKLGLFSCAIALAASPAMAKPAADSQTLGEHLASLITPKGQACYEQAKRDAAEPNQSIVTCQIAIAELQAGRRAAKDASIGQLANYDFLESALETGLGAAFAENDKDLSKDACSASERGWTMRRKLQSVPKAAVGEEIYAAYNDVPDSQRRVLELCRGKFGTPADASPLPGS